MTELMSYIFLGTESNNTGTGLTATRGMCCWTEGMAMANQQELLQRFAQSKENILNNQGETKCNVLPLLSW